MQANPSTQKAAGPTKDRLLDLAKIVGMTYKLPLAEVLAPQNSAAEHAEARKLVMHLARTMRVANDGRMQDVLMCSMKNINDACTAVAKDTKLLDTASAIWSTYSMGNMPQAPTTTVTLSALCSAIEPAFGATWQDIKMLGEEKGDGRRALEAFVLIGIEILHKDEVLLGRMASRTPAEIIALHKLAQGDLAGRHDDVDAVGKRIKLRPFKETVLTVCGTLKLHPPPSWK